MNTSIRIKRSPCRVSWQVQVDTGREVRTLCTHGTAFAAKAEAMRLSNRYHIPFTGVQK